MVRASAWRWPPVARSGRVWRGRESGACLPSEAPPPALVGVRIPQPPAPLSQRSLPLPPTLRTLWWRGKRVRVNARATHRHTHAPSFSLSRRPPTFSPFPQAPSRTALGGRLSTATSGRSTRRSVAKVREGEGVCVSEGRAALRLLFPTQTFFPEFSARAGHPNRHPPLRPGPPLASRDAHCGL